MEEYNKRIEEWTQQDSVGSSKFEAEEMEDLKKVVYENKEYDEEDEEEIYISNSTKVDKQTLGF